MPGKKILVALLEEKKHWFLMKLFRNYYLSQLSVFFPN